MPNYRIYQPALLRQQIHELYRLKEATGLPMTYHARLAVDRYLKEIEENARQAAERCPQPGQAEGLEVPDGSEEDRSKIKLDHREG